jgi:4-amino-4-deoxy-L-arabinose transferase-like glycosyltransferase
MHPLGAPALMALVKALVPDPVLAMRLAGALATAATACGLYAVARLLGGGRATGMAAGLLYIAHTSVLGGLATNTEVLFAPFIVLAAWLLLREAIGPAPPRTSRVVMAGLVAGLALLVKQVNAVESSALWLTMIGAAWAAGRLSPGRVALLALAFAAGAGLPSLAVAGGYAAAGHFDDWLQGNLIAPLTYAGAAEDPAPTFRRGVLGALPHLLWLAVAACGIRLADAGTRRSAWLLLPWLAGAVLAILLPGKFYDHYFLILLPPLSLLAAFGLAAVTRFALQPRLVLKGFAVGVALLMALPFTDMLLPRLAHGAGLRVMDPVRQVARAANAALRPGEALYVANWHPVVYALAGRPPPTRYAFPGHLAGVYARVTGIDADAELARVLAIPPGVIVVSTSSWGPMRPDARQRIEAALASDYTLFATVKDGTGPVEVWRRR